MIRPMLSTDWNDVRQIYFAGIDTGKATFTDKSEVSDFSSWIMSKVSNSCFVAMCNDQVAGWSCLNPTSKRQVYQGVTEVSVYVDPAFQGKGFGKSLLKALINFAEENGIWTLQAGIIDENLASIGLHKKLGFREIGFREKVGKLKGEWKNTLLLERRSKTIF